ncbi:flagellar protein FliT [Neobacillus sp. D3-1R]|uniref:flagellar protein FliT n=1 Tax=Neobacillus sp. D3-1R TaxID=3445778 RepID=UPI003F9EE00E
MVKQAYDCTLELLQKLQSNIDRDEKIVQVEAALETREQLLQQLSAPYTDEEKQLGQQLIQLNQRLSQLLSREKMLIQKDIKDLTIKKESNTKYVNPYQSLSTDGMFYDKRK